jgi:mandelate racemase
MPPSTDFPVLRVRAISAVGVAVPMRFTLGTSRGRITKAPLLLIDVETAEGVTGRAYLWSYFPRAMTAIASILQEVEERTKGDAVSRGESPPTIPAASD